MKKRRNSRLRKKERGIGDSKERGPGETIERTTGKDRNLNMPENWHGDRKLAVDYTALVLPRFVALSSLTAAEVWCMVVVLQGFNLDCKL